MNAKIIVARIIMKNTILKYLPHKMLINYKGKISNI